MDGSGYLGVGEAILAKDGNLAEKQSQIRNALTIGWGCSTPHPTA